MDEIDEFEQGERVRAWLRNNGSSLIGGVAIGLAALGGWQWWQVQQDHKRVEAAAEYQALVEAVEAKDDTKAGAHASSLAQSFPDSPYPVLAALRRAELLHGEGKDDEALKVLDGADGANIDPVLVELAKLRAARLLTATGKPEDAIKRLDAINNTAFPAVAAEIRGDAEMALGRRDAAREAYEKALASLDIAAPTRPMVELKLTDAGGSPTAQPEI